MPALKFSQVSHEFQSRSGPIHVLQKISFSIQKNEFVCILGPSGCGKSTILRLASGLFPATQGLVELDSMAQNAKSIVFQEPRLLPWLTVLENTLLPFSLGPKAKSTSKEETSAARQHLKTLALDHRESAFPHELSGGMKMRAAIARALVLKPKLLMMDEPFAALDEGARHKLQAELRDLFLQRKFSVLFVTHSVAEAVFLADRLIIMTDQGKIHSELPIPLGERNESLRYHASYLELVQAASARIRGVQ